MFIQFFGYVGRQFYFLGIAEICTFIQAVQSTRNGYLLFRCCLRMHTMSFITLLFNPNFGSISDRFVRLLLHFRCAFVTVLLLYSNRVYSTQLNPITYYLFLTKAIWLNQCLLFVCVVGWER